LANFQDKIPPYWQEALRQKITVRDFTCRVRSSCAPSLKTEEYDMSINDDGPVRRSRREVLQSGLALAGGLWLPPAFAQSNFDWKRFKGEKIEVTLQKSRSTTCCRSTSPSSPR
jgi:hypothetical protein